MDCTHTILFFEDDTALAKEIAEYLQGPPKKESDPKLVIQHYAKAADALRAIKEWPSSTGPAAALLDLRQEDYTAAGLDISKELTKLWQTPVIFLSEWDSTEDQIRAHDDGGARTYLSKVHLKEPAYKELLRSVLIANIGSGPNPPYAPDVYESGSLKVDMDIGEVSWKGKEVRLNNTDLGVLDELARPENRRRPRRFVDLLRAGGMKPSPDDHEEIKIKINVRQRIRLIRKAFARVDPDFVPACKQERHGIVKVFGTGYRWIPDK